MFSIVPMFLQLIVAAAVVTGMYWLIRLAVRHALEDADKRRSKSDASGRSIGL